MIRNLTRRVLFEALDPRLAMAGNVTADLVAGSLVLQGDSQANWLEISPMFANGQTQPGTFVLRGRNSPGSLPTTINGQASLIMRFVSADMTIQLNDGDDFILFNSDEYSDIAGNLTITTGNGMDTVHLARVVTGGFLSISTGNDSDQVIANDVTVLMTGTADEFSIRTGAGADILELREIATAEDMRIDTGADNFRDVVGVMDATIGDDLVIFTGSGDDRVLVNRFVADDLAVDSGDGTDAVRVDGGYVNRLFALLGGGNGDYLDIRRFSANFASVRGGAGSGDRLDLWDDVFINLLDEDEFEAIVT